MSRFSRTPDKTRRAREFRKTVSKTEYKLWPYLRASQPGAPFRRQHPVGAYYFDYACVPLKLAIEIDGPWHDQAHDSQRDAYLKSIGYDVLRFSVEDVDENLDGVVEAIYNAVHDLLQGRE